MAGWICKAGALFPSIFASIGVFGPLLAVSFDNPALGALASLSIYRPYFIGLAGLTLIYSFFTTFLKKQQAGSLHPKSYEFAKEEIVLSVTTLLVFFAIFFPYLRGVTPGESGVSYEGEGWIIQVDEGERKIALKQDEIKDFMPAMTMEYDVEPYAPLRGLKSGDRVRFKLSPREIEFVVAELWKEKGP